MLGESGLIRESGQSISKDLGVHGVFDHASFDLHLLGGSGHLIPCLFNTILYRLSALNWRLISSRVRG